MTFRCFVENGKLRLDRAGSSGLGFRALVFGLWVTGLPGGAQNELIELLVWAGAHLRQQLAGSGLAGWPESLGRFHIGLAGAVAP